MDGAQTGLHPFWRAILVQHLPHSHARRMAAERRDLAAARPQGHRPRQTLAKVPQGNLDAGRRFLADRTVRRIDADLGKSHGDCFTSHYWCLALVLSLVFERRSFCNYLCPIGGFTGLYAQAGPVELRVKDADICAAHS